MMKFFKKSGKAEEQAQVVKFASQHDDDDPIVNLNDRDPHRNTLEPVELKIRSAEADAETNIQAKAADSNNVVYSRKAADDSTGTQSLKMFNGGYINQGVQSWYASNSFIGWQTCAIIAQHWLVEKACAMPGRDAVRNGYEISDPDGKPLARDMLSKILRKDRQMGVLTHCMEFVKFVNIFGLRIVLFQVDSDDSLYYENPFNIDGVRRGSYRGMVQVDPYWTTPVLDMRALSDPSSASFYQPTYWIINGKKYHHTHLHIGIGAAVPDILKPSYYYGGISLVQRIYERVYAAERTANEAPLLALTKRTNVLKANLTKSGLSFSSLAKRISEWATFRDNFGVRVIDINEEAQQQDTTLANFDEMVSSQYQLVAAIAEVPYTKLMATSPKGFGATGEYEELSYHEKLESIQAEMLTPLLDRHHALLTASMGIDVEIDTVWNPVGTKTPEQLADLNKAKNEAGKLLIEGGVISPLEERHRVRTDKHSGYSSLIEYEGLTAGAESAGNERVEQQSEADQPLISGQASLLPEGAEQDPLVQLLKADAMKATTANPVQPSVAGTVQPSVKPGARGIWGAGQESPAESPDVSAMLQQLVSELSKLISGKAADEDRGKASRMWNGHRLWTETAKGESRRGKDESGKSFHTEHMPVDYGYIDGAEGNDGDSVDCFIGERLGSNNVFVINQKRRDGGFDEHKVMIGFDTEQDAVNTYQASYEPGWTGLGSVVAMDIGQFNEWLKSGDKSKPCGG